MSTETELKIEPCWCGREATPQYLMGVDRWIVDCGAHGKIGGFKTYKSKEIAIREWNKLMTEGEDEE